MTPCVAGCEDFATPAELDRPQILAIATEPPAVVPGARSTVSILVANSDGEIEAPDVVWESVAAAPEAQPIGTVELNPDGTVSWIAPADIPAVPPTLALVQATVDIGTGTPLIANKAIIVGTLPLANPQLVTFDADGNNLLAEPALTVARDGTVALEVATDPPDTNDTTYAWYSTIGEIDRYRMNPTELVTAETGEGWLFAVVRDGMGGVTWSKATVTVE